ALFPAAGNLPELRLFIHSRRCQGLAVRAKDDVIDDLPCVPVHPPKLSRRRGPDPDGRILTRGGEEPAVRAPGKARDHLSVPRQGLESPTRVRLAEEDVPII